MQEPLALSAVRDIRELDAEATAIRIAQLFQQVTQRAVGWTIKAAATDDAIQIGIRHSEVIQVQQRLIWPIVAEGVQVGNEMPQLAVGMDRIEDANRERARRFDFGAGGELRGACGGRRGFRAVYARLKSGKKRLPLLAHRPRVFAILLPQPVDELGVGAVDKIKR